MVGATGSFRAAQDEGIAYKYTQPGGLEKTAQEALGNNLSGAPSSETPRGISAMPMGTLILVGIAAWYFWPKIKRYF